MFKNYLSIKLTRFVVKLENQDIFLSKIKDKCCNINLLQLDNAEKLDIQKKYSSIQLSVFLHKFLNFPCPFN